jgi:hypothetical protein
MKPLLLAAALLLPASLASAELTPGQFTKLHKELQPPHEAWTTLPWLSSLLPAQHTALAEGKPLFIWAMDGHPMGCT